MKGDAEVIYNDSSKRLDEPLDINKVVDVYILSRHLEEIFKVLGIPTDEKTLKTDSGELHTLLKTPLDSNNTHNALHDSRSMARLCFEYFSTLNK